MSESKSSSTREYWYVEFNERFENVYKWTRKAVCIARHPADWIRCKREFDDDVCKMTGNVRTLWEIVNANPITKDDYDIFIGDVQANIATEQLSGLDYLMHQLEKDIKFSKSLYEIDKKAWLKHGKIPLYEEPMCHHKKNVTELTSAYEEIIRLHDIARGEGKDGDWTGGWTQRLVSEAKS